MSKGIYVALSGAISQEAALDSTAANVANAATTGYQRLRPIFREALATASKRDPNLHYAAEATTELDTARGATRVTGRSLDAALPEGVYLATTTPRGERYTRAGSLVVDGEGTLRTSSGTAVTGDTGAPIKVASAGDEVHLDTDGSVKQGAAVIGKLKLVRFEKPSLLAPEGATLLGPGQAGVVTVTTNERIEVGSLEESNAHPVAAMTDLMSASRTFDAFQKVLDQFGEIDRKLLSTVPNASE